MTADFSNLIHSIMENYKANEGSDIEAVKAEIISAIEADTNAKIDAAKADIIAQLQTLAANENATTEELKAAILEIANTVAPQLANTENGGEASATGDASAAA